MPLNLIWLEQATHPVVLEAGDAAAEPALRSFDLAGSLGHGHAREERWADKLVVPPLGPRRQTARAAPSLRWARCAVGSSPVPSAVPPRSAKPPRFCSKPREGKDTTELDCRQPTHAKQAGSRRSFADSSGLAIGRRHYGEVSSRRCCSPTWKPCSAPQADLRRSDRASLGQS